jgi:phenylacetate-CoA ligase
LSSIQELVSYAFEHAEGFRAVMEENGLTPDRITSIDDLVKIPVIKKDRLPELQQVNLPFAGLSTLTTTEMARVFMSPGPIYDPQTHDDDYWRFSEALASAGFGENDIVQNTFSYHLSPAGFMFDSALRKLGATVIPAGTGNRELQLQVMKDVKVTGYVGTPSFFTILLDAAVEKGWVNGRELTLSKVFFTAEMTPVALRQRCEELGIQVFEGYGTADCGCIAFEDKEGPGLKLTSSAIVQICDPVSGELVECGEGEIVVTLFDKSYPLIRFGTGDLSKWVEGYEGKRIAGVLGRVSDGVKVKGMFVREKQLAAVLANEGYTSFQALVLNVESQDQLVIEIESDAELNGDLIGKLQDVIRVSPILKRVNLGDLTKKGKLLVDERMYS